MTKILIVEDEDKVRKMYLDLLSSEGFEVHESSNAKDASLLLNKIPIDIVILDIKIPLSHGSVLYNFIRTINNKIKVIVSSVYPVDEQKMIIKEADDYYDKSHGIDILLKKIKKIERFVNGQNNILIADDDLKQRRFFYNQLISAGYNVIEANNDKELLEDIKGMKDVVLAIIDIQNIKKNGFNICEQIKKSFSQIKIIISSHIGQIEVSDVSDYYDKGNNMSILMEKIKHLLNDMQN